MITGMPPQRVIYSCAILQGCLHRELFIAVLFYRDVSTVNVLVPGAGLGRLAFEFAAAGFKCQGNEWSLFMLLASNFVLNK